MENWLAHKAMVMLFHAQLLSLLLWISGKRKFLFFMTFVKCSQSQKNFIVSKELESLFCINMARLICLFIFLL